jgi:hypothetical protein
MAALSVDDPAFLLGIGLACYFSAYATDGVEPHEL